MCSPHGRGFMLYPSFLLPEEFPLAFLIVSSNKFNIYLSENCLYSISLTFYFEITINR